MDGPTALMSVIGDNRPPTLESAAAQLGVSVEDIDASYGIVPIDPGRHIYAVQVRADRVPRRPADRPFRGPFENPIIEPIGPPKKRTSG